MFFGIYILSSKYTLATDFHGKITKSATISNVYSLRFSFYPK